jgi:MFS family permease
MTGGTERAARAALYLGGLLGPFGSGVLAALIPELRGAFHATTAEVTAGITVYMLPFAALQLVSGTIGERLGYARTIRCAYLVFAASAFAAAAASSVVPFLLARAVQGGANAFTSPLLLAALAAAGGQRLGRRMGTFNAVQTAGMVMAPLCGGLVGAIEPRLAFALPGLLALALAAGPLPAATPREPGDRPPRLRAAFTRRTLSVAVAAGLSFLAVTGLTFLVALQAADAFGLSTTERGLLLAAFGVTGVLAGRPAGELVDRLGPAPVAVAGALLSGALVALLGLAGTPGLLAAAWAGAGVGSALQWAALNTLAVGSAPANRGGAISVIGTFKFAGSACAPLVWLPVFHADPALAFVLAGVTAAAVAFIGVVARGERPAPPQPGREAAQAAAQG